MFSKIHRLNSAIGGGLYKFTYGGATLMRIVYYGTTEASDLSLSGLYLIL